METLNLTWFDILTISIVLISGIMAFARGLLREVFSIVALIVAGLAALMPAVRGTAASFLGFIQPPIIAEMAAGVLVFIVVFVIITLLTNMLAGAVHQSTEIGMLDRVAGAAFGLLRGALIPILIVLFMNHVTRPPQSEMPKYISDARVYPLLQQGADIVGGALSAFIPRARTYIEEQRAKGESAAPAGAPAPAAPAPNR